MITVELTPEQVKQAFIDYAQSPYLDENLQKKLALILFQRNERVDPFVALRAVLRQVARDHCLTRQNMEEMLK